jgi:hypothetical protein
MLPPDILHCLAIDLTHAPEAVRAVLEQRAAGSDELCDLLCEAGRASLPLLLLSSQTGLTLVSTRRHHVRAFRPVLALIREALLGVAGWRTTPVRIAGGSDAGREFLKVALSDLRSARHTQHFTRNLRAAAELSLACGALTSELWALTRLAEHTANRVWNETRLGRLGPSAAELELETMDAERIVEEELVAWQSSSPALRSSHRPMSDADIGGFGAEERHSLVRVRPTSVLSKLRTA